AVVRPASACFETKLDAGSRRHHADLRRHRLARDGLAARCIAPLGPGSARPLPGFRLKWTREGPTGADFGHRFAIEPCLAKSNVKRKIVAYLPNRPSENRVYLYGIEFPLVNDLGDRADRPTIWSFEDGTHEQIATVRTRVGGAKVEVNRSPRPS